MRSLESLLLFIDLVALLTLLLAPLRVLRWPRYVAPLALLVAIAQVLLEGPRWEMIPAYAMAMVLFSIWLLGRLMPSGMHVGRLVYVLGAGGGALVLAISIALPVLLRCFTSPGRAGPTRSAP